MDGAAKKQFQRGEFLRLEPFPTGESLPMFSVHGRAYFLDTYRLEVEFQIVGSLELLDLPSESSRPGFKEGIWEQTCFGFFLSEVESNSYMEFVFSPSRDYCVLTFKNYRKGGAMRVPPWRPTKMDFDFRDEGVCQARFQIDLEGFPDFVKVLDQNDPMLDYGLSAVLGFKKPRVTSFWALQHLDPDKPDFHVRDSFVGQLP